MFSPSDFSGALSDITLQKWQEFVTNCKEGKITIWLKTASNSQVIKIFQARKLNEIHIERGYKPLSERELEDITQAKQQEQVAPAIRTQGKFKRSEIIPSEQVNEILGVEPSSKKAKNTQNAIIELIQKINPNFKETVIEQLKASESLDASYVLACKLIANFVFSPVYISLEQLENIYELFFFTDFQSYSIEEHDELHICKIINDLYRCTLGLGNKLALDLENLEWDDLENLSPRISIPQVICLSNVLILNEDNQKTNRWVFKRMPPEDAEHSTSIPCSLLPKRELMAHLVNFHGQFPIPLALLMSFGGKLYSVHKYVDGKVGLSAMDEESAVDFSNQSDSASNVEKKSEANSNNQSRLSEPIGNISEDKFFSIEKISFHKLLVFDLLFSNGDRHAGNLIFTREAEFAEFYSVMGIDHGDCMININDMLKINYLNLGVFNCHFEDVIFELVTEANEVKYAEIMNTRDFEIPEDAIQWMGFVCKCIRSLQGDLFSANDIASILIYIRNSDIYKIDKEDLLEIFKQVTNLIKQHNELVDQEIDSNTAFLQLRNSIVHKYKENIQKLFSNIFLEKS